MNTNATRLLAIVMAGFCVNVMGADHPELKAFPPAKAGMDRFVIELPNKERGEEDAFRVELIVGKEIMTDPVNLFHLGVTIEPRDLEGWGYTYYEVKGLAEVAGTLMAPPEGAPQILKFVSGQPLLILYNSRLPIVIYAPKGLEVRYRIWKASDVTEKAEIK